jgi:hypothetical protein
MRVYDAGFEPARQLKNTPYMKFIVLIIFVAQGLVAFPQMNTDYLGKMALNVGIKQPVARSFAYKAVKRPVNLDSVNLVKFHSAYVKTLYAGSITVSSGVLLVVSHILVAAFVPHFNRDGVIVLATFGVASFTAGSLAVPLGASEMHRYKKSLKIALAKRDL